MPTGRHDNWNALLPQMFDDVPCGQQPVVQIMLVQYFTQADGDRLEVATRKTTVGRKPLRQNQNIALPVRQLGVIRTQEAAYVRERIFFGRHRAAVGITENFAGDFDSRRVCIAGFRRLIKCAFSAKRQASI